jgi:hypothetical protein
LENNPFFGSVRVDVQPGESMTKLSMENDLVRKTLRSLSTQKKTAEEIHRSYTQLFPPSLLFRKRPSITFSNLEWVLGYLVKEGYVVKEVTRYLDHEALGEDKRIYSLSLKGMQYFSRKK